MSGTRARGTKRPAPQNVAPQVASGTRRSKRLVVGVVLLVGLVGGGVLVWPRLRAVVARSEGYRLDEANIHITPPPAWIHADVRREALRAASLDGELSLLDENLTERIARGFTQHPWVSRVTRTVKQFPASVQVDLEYRKPVVLVLQAGKLWAVDESGVRLPPEDFAANESKNYLLIGGVDTSPWGPVGTPWGDPLVVAGAKIAAAIGERWQKLGLAQIRLQPAPNKVASSNSYDVLTPGGTAIHWGSPPGSEGGKEPTAADKVARLESYLLKYASLDAAAKHEVINLAAGLTPLGVPPRAAGSTKP